MLMPFMFVVTEKPVDESTSPQKFVVKTATWDYVSYDSRWMYDKDLPSGKVLIPDVDRVQETFVFDTEREALDKMAELWKRSSCELTRVKKDNIVQEQGV